MGRLDGKAAIVTGGASGIGEATVELFVAEGCGVLVSDVQDEKGRALADRLGDAAAYVHTDVSSESDVKTAVDAAVSRFGRLDCIFNNAGIGEDFTPVEQTRWDDFKRLVNINIGGVFLGIKHAARVMKEQGSGSIINTASVAGLLAGNGGHIYSATKHAVIGLTKVTATELGESGVRVNAICPGGIVTPIFAEAAGMAEKADEVMRAVTEAFKTAQPIRRPGMPIDIANAALWLASDESSFVNGTYIVVDGGATCGAQWSQATESSDLMTELL
jgi:NAD(P)-dependent dehydrogenase (short-subunit alcohol dehydrogenase family)